MCPLKTFTMGWSLSQRRSRKMVMSEISQEDRMTKKRDVVNILAQYDLDDAKIGMIASHSALDLSAGARDENLPTVAICERGREQTYKRYPRIITKTIILEKFKDIIKNEIQSQLRSLNIIFVPNRSLTAYVPVTDVELNLQIPVFGNRWMLRTDERELQHDLLESAGITQPFRFMNYRDIDRLCMVKAMEPIKKIERAFFTCASPEEFLKKWKSKFSGSPAILEEQLAEGEVWIEEFTTGAQFNFNYFYSPLKREVEFLGIDRRIQTNLDGILRLPAEDQIGRKFDVDYVEIGHESATIRESMLEKVFDIGEKFVAASKKMYPPGIIGPFSLQGAVSPKLGIIIYDLSPRMPGSPVLYSSPYSFYHWGYQVTSGRRVAMEIKEAIDTDDLQKIIT
jgi:5-formaminoimidazole-4-carboxamide-1-(beta)-D-ribofuranosyl 5'-monophosphate synthetase